jgi:hypothetical protein
MASLSLYGFALALSTLGCTKDGTSGDSDTQTTGPEAVCTEPAEIECIDALILSLSLHDDKVSEGAVVTSTDGQDFVTAVDASAGGYSQASQNPWTYIRFTVDGAEKVEIDDETALESMAWHLALHRYKIRINSGASGPSCVSVSPKLEGDYAGLSEVGEPTWYQDAYMTASCEMTNESSGLPDSPQVAMSPWWSYDSCVKTTGTPFLVQLDDGHVLKLVVESYYLTGQADCNESNVIGEESANYSLRWQVLE